MYEYDTIDWKMRIPYVIISSFYVALFIYASYHYFSKMSIIGIKYGGNTLSVYYYAVAMLLLFRLGYFYAGDEAIPLPPILYGMCAYLPLALCIIICVSFLRFLLKSLYNRLATGSNAFYKAFDFFAGLFLVLTTLFSLWAYGCDIVKYVFKMENAFPPIYFYYNAGVCILIAAVMVFVIWRYMKALKEYPNHFRDRRRFIVFAFVTTCLNIAMRTVNSILIGSDVSRKLDKLSRSDKRPYTQIYHSVFMIVGDLLPIFSYTLYLKKDTENLVIFNIDDTVPSDDTIEVSSLPASLN
eukprot:TRINITY_DN9530_c0_g1_i2.p1 TRINITY_DN9530_c0_g1~~TRINITY_DN9530_c0_g1_i2.p1  ORF type:complete len:297 (+),score=34.09 TRINITY_DN9530_c0_g1_i2:70-960(+)